MILVKMMFSDKSLIEKNQRGLIHAPDEAEDAFLLRSQNAQTKELPPNSELAKQLFDIDPDWVHLCYSDRRLRLWEGGCTWIDNSRITLQLRTIFEKKPCYLGYSREEILAHELVHVVRSHFEEPMFEEILAYQTSASFLRRFLGPVFRSSKESTVFIILLLVTCLATFITAFQSVMVLGTLGVVAGGTFRLLRAQLMFSRARRNLAKVVGKKMSLAVMIRLTDREIMRFSKMKREQIVTYAVKMSRTQLRWKQIRLAYFIKQSIKNSGF